MPPTERGSLGVAASTALRIVSHAGFPHSRRSKNFGRHRPAESDTVPKHVAPFAKSAFGYLQTCNTTGCYLNGPNPIREVGVPSAPEGDETYAYSLEEVTRMLTYLPQPAYTIVALA